MEAAFSHFWLLLLTHLVAGPVEFLLAWMLRGWLGRAIGSIPGLEARTLRGEWDTTFWKDGVQLSERATVKQFLRSVWGTINFKAKSKSYAFHGTIREDVLVATYEIRGRRSALDRGTFTLRVNDDGDTMEGRYAWTDSATSGVHSDRYEWKKASSS